MDPGQRDRFGEREGAVLVTEELRIESVGIPYALPCHPQQLRAQPNEHLSLAKHLTAEAKTEEFVAGKGVVVKWELIRHQNHWFDALYNACAAVHVCGVRLVDEKAPEPSTRPSRRINAPDWIDLQKWLHQHEGRW